MVRGSAALLIAVAYFLAVGELPEVHGDAGRALAGAAGALAVGACALLPVAGRDDALALLPFAFGAALLAAGLAAAGVGAAANPVEALLAAAVGVLFGVGFAFPAAVIAVPLLVAGIDLFAVLTGPSEAAGGGDAVDVLTFDLPAWGGGAGVARLGLLDAAFLAMFAAWAWRFDLRPRLAAGAMLAALAGAVVVSVLADRSLPALPFVAAALLAVSLDRLPALLRRGPEGYRAAQ